MAPTVLVAIGHEGVGKSTLFETMARYPGVFHINKDVINKELLNGEPMLGLYYELYVRMQAYDKMYERALPRLADNDLVIIDGSIADKFQTLEFKAFAEKVRRIAVLHCVCPWPLQQERVYRRGLDHDLVRWNNPAKNEHRLALQERDHERVLRLVPHLRLEMDNPVERNAQYALNYALDPALLPFPVDKL